MRGVEWVLRGLAVISLLTSLVWVLGSMGIGLIYEAAPVRDAAQSIDLEAASGYPSAAVEPEREVVMGILRSGALPVSDGAPPGGFAELSVAFDVHLYEPSLAQRLAYVGLQTGLALGVAWLWWSLATLVAASRRNDPFSPANARRLRGLGLLVAIGGPAYVVGTWLVLRWLVGTSELADTVLLRGLAWGDLPWVATGAGLALLVLAAVWRRGSEMRRELEGLV